MILFFLIFTVVLSDLSIEYNDDKQRLEINGNGKIDEDFSLIVLNYLKERNNLIELNKIKEIQINQNEKQFEWKSVSFFQQFDSLETVSININQLPNYLFVHSSIKSITFGKDVETIGNYCFYDCEYLENISFEKNCQLTTINNYAFKDCIRLTTIVLPKSIENIDFRKVFDGCVSLESIEIENGGKYSSDGNTIYSKNSTVVEYYYSQNKIMNKYQFHEESEIIEEKAFVGESIEMIEMSNKLITIKQKAFYGNKNIESIIIPSNVTSIQSYAFAFNDGLENVIIQSENIKLGEKCFYARASLHGILCCVVWNIRESPKNRNYTFIVSETITKSDNNFNNII